MADDPQNQDEAVAVRAAIDTRNAADQLMDFGLAVRSWGVWALVVGVGFASSALGLRFDNPGDMQAPEFISCLSFSSVIAIVGAVVYLIEHITRRTVYGEVLRIQLGATGTPDNQTGPSPNGSAQADQASLPPAPG